MKQTNSDSLTVLGLICLVGCLLCAGCKPINEFPLELLQTDDGLTDDVIQLSFFYKPPYEEAEQSLVIAQFDTIILTRQDEWYRDQITTYADQQVLQYLRFERIHDPCMLAQLSEGQCSCDEQPFSNNVAWHKSDICFLREEYPDWFLRDTEGNVIYVDDTVFMDIGHPGWQAFYLSRIQQSQEEDGWYGVFLDNVRGSMDRFDQAGHIPKKYPTDISYVNATEDFLKFLYESYFEPNNIPLYANLRSMSGDSHEVWQRYLMYLDGVMDEFWAVDWGPGYLSPADWLHSIERAVITQEAGDHFIAVAHGTANETARQEFAFASYLLISQGNASFRYTDDGYREVLFFNNYLLNPGVPTSSSYRTGAVWQRDFENGYVSVNPVTREVNIEITETQ